jgi:pimeloyl-ACP methyl ester carboxylesterase
VLFVPLLTGVLALAENLRADELARQRALCRGPLPLALLRALANAVWSFWLTALLLPLGWFTPSGLDRAAHGGGGRDGPPPLVLIHGLYHNPAAWTLLRRRLRAAGFTRLRAYGYSSFGLSFAAIAADLGRALREAAREDPEGRVLLAGHSLGGLLARAACADADLAAAGVRVAGVVTLGAPHRGSTLAGMLGMGRLARSLRPGGAALRQIRALPCCAAPGLNLFSPTDGMVLPLSGSLLDARETAAGWTQECLGPVSHVGLLYDRAAARRMAEFLLEASRREAETPGRA